MRGKSTILILILLHFILASPAEDAPFTTAGTITNAVALNNVVVPVTVTDFVSIGYFKLTLQYLTANATYVSTAVNPAFAGTSISHTIADGIGKLVYIYPQTAGGITLPDKAHLLDITFTYKSGTTPLAWGYDTPLICEYKKYSDGSFILLNDLPKSSFYINGGISNRAAPITTVASIANAVSGTQIDVPVTVTGFTTIGSFYLKMDYDSTVLTLVSVTPLGSLGGFLYSLANVPGTTKKRLTTGWFSSNLTLANGTTIYTIKFNYTNTAGKSNYSQLTWYDNGPSCEYTDKDGIILLDNPTSTYYVSGLVYSKYAPKTWLPAITNATPNSPQSIPVKANSFSDVSSFNLGFEYDTIALTYNNFTPDAALASGMTVTNNTPSGGKRKLVIAWTGTSPLTLTDGTSLVALDFTYKTNATALTWVTDDTNSCRFNDAVGNAYYDLPKASYYTDGMVASQVAPLTFASSASPTVGQQVTLPVKVFDFINTGYFKLTLDYDPGVLTYQSASLVAALGGTYTSTTSGAGRINMEWTGSATTMPDDTTVMELVFTYNGGETALVWYDNGSSCKYAQGTTDSAYYDKPKNQFYINGYVGPNAVTANFTANNLLPAVGQTVTMSNSSTGSPTEWLWIINPPYVSYTGGTSATSQNPQVQFTVNGVYSITLVATKGYATSVKARMDYIHAGTPNLWTGVTGTEWSTASNWHNYLVPESTATVTIPTSAPHWPVLTESLVLGGSRCLNLTMEGNAQITVQGDLTINPGSALTMTGAGVLNLSGDWDNSGSFSCGTGTVVFGGEGSATIIDNGTTEIFYRVDVAVGKSVNVEGSVRVEGE